MESFFILEGIVYPMQPSVYSSGHRQSRKEGKLKRKYRVYKTGGRERVKKAPGGI